MQSVLKRHVGYGSRGSSLARTRNGNRLSGHIVRDRRTSPADVIDLVRSVETSLAGRLSLTVLVEAPGTWPADLPFATIPSSATPSGELVDSLAALVREAASSSVETNGNVRITVGRREISGGSASAVGIVPGAYVVLDIEDHPEAGCRSALGACPIGPGIGLAAARAVIVGAGGSIGLSRSLTGGVRFTVYMPACRAPGIAGAP